MKPKSLRQFAKRYGTVGLLLVGIYLIAWHYWTKRRIALLACVAILLASAYALNVYNHSSVCRNGHRLYVGQISTKVRCPHCPQEMELLAYWDEGSKTEEVRALAREFAMAVEQQNPIRARDIGNQLCPRFRPIDYYYFKKDGKWLFRTVLGQAYLKRAWLDEAESEFQSVLSAVPPGEPHWGKSLARKNSAYGLARAEALRGCYGAALKWLADVPGEYNGGCGNANEAEAVANYPQEVVWMAASKPFPTAMKELQAIMSGRFCPMESSLNGDTSEEQRQHAALEAGLTLGCLYNARGKRADATACWDLVAGNAGAQHESGVLARTMLDRLRRN